MKKNEFNAKFREHAKQKLSPTNAERNLVSILYNEFQKVFNGNCIQIGSYPRFTATRPIHDLDILYILGNYDPQNVDPRAILKQLQEDIRTKFKNPTKYKYDIELQTHSIAVTFLENNKEIFFVDIVPSYISDCKNEFGDDTYWVPEIANVGYSKRNAYYQQLSENSSTVSWIKSDPRGYISLAQTVNQQSDDFRKVVKFLKTWKFECKKLYDDFKLKSFHIEQVIVGYFLRNPALDFFDAIFRFYLELEDIISKPQIKDRADDNKFIDDYVKELSRWKKEKILEARDDFMIKLEGFNSTSTVSALLSGGFYTRKCVAEQFLFDFGIPTFIDNTLSFMVDGYVRKKDGFRSGYWLSNNGDKVFRDLKIDFSLKTDNSNADLTKWKVRNSDGSSDPRGEITDNHTRYTPETSSFIGTHYVESYAIKNNTCVARHKRNVIIK